MEEKKSCIVARLVTMTFYAARDRVDADRALGMALDTIEVRREWHEPDDVDRAVLCDGLDIAADILQSVIIEPTLSTTPEPK